MFSDKTKVWLCGVLATAVLTGGSGTWAGATAQNPTVAPQISAMDATAFLWGVEVLHWEVASDLSATEAAVQYNGDVVQIAHEEKPSAGNTFLLVELRIQKQKIGPGVFKWANVYVEDAEGNRYARHENDTFLQVYQFKRLKATDLTLGTNEGFACFEIPEFAADTPLALVYEAPEGLLRVALETAEENGTAKEVAAQ